jgi:hypothetical protein
VDELGAEGADRHAARRQNGGGEVLKELLEAELREGGGAAEDQHGRGYGTLSNIPGVVKVLSSQAPAFSVADVEKAVDHSRGLIGISGFHHPCGRSDCRMPIVQ